MDPLGNRCFSLGCKHHPAYRCSYIDRDGMHCMSDWCDEHVVTVDSQPYCRRCSGIVSIIGHLPHDQWPSLNNRAPSLVAWVAYDLDDPIQSMLEKAAFGRPNMQISQQAIGSQASAWSFGWHLSIDGLVAHSIFLEVSEAKDSYFTVIVDGQRVVIAEPPWITRRREGKWVPEYQDQNERQAFYAEISRRIAGALRIR